MVNPYKSPEQRVTEESIFVPRLWSVYHRLFASIFTTIVTGFFIFWAWRFLGHEKSLTFVELRQWLLLFFGMVLVCFSWSPLRRKCLNTVSVSQYSYGIVGTLFLGGIASLFLELWMAWYSGVEFESFVVSNRALGGYVWIFWLNIGITSILPVVICLHGVSTRRWIIVPSLVFVSFVSIANLRMNFFLNHANEIPSSWPMFFGL